MIKFHRGMVSPEHQKLITEGFIRHSYSHMAPPYKNDEINWLAFDPQNQLVGALTAEVFWGNR
jgi:hypothetical protein